MEESRILAEYARREQEIPADRYSLTRPAVRFGRENIERHVVARLERDGLHLPALDVLDIGCGYGNWLRNFIRWGADPARLCGVELNPTRANAARAKLPEAQILTGSAEFLQWPARSFDLVTQFAVFTSILDPEMKAEIAREMLRVLRPGGVILWYDFRVNNPRNRNVRGVGIREIRELYPGCQIEAQSVTLAPPLAELLVPISWPLAQAAEALPFLRTHLLAVIRK